MKRVQRKRSKAGLKNCWSFLKKGPKEEKTRRVERKGVKKEDPVKQDFKPSEFI